MGERKRNAGNQMSVDRQGGQQDWTEGLSSAYAVAPDDVPSPPTFATNPDDTAQSPSADAAELCEV